MPLPTMTISASAGRSSVVRCPMRNSFGSLCQKEFVEVGVGSVARACRILDSCNGVKDSSQSPVLDMNLYIPPSKGYN